MDNTPVAGLGISFFLILIIAFVIMFFQGYKYGEESAYYNQGYKAYSEGIEVADWPYDDWNGPEFEWVKGWYVSKGTYQIDQVENNE